MAIRTWETLKTQYCSRVDAEVSFEAEMVFPPEYLPDQPARVPAHRCSQAMTCMLADAPTCVWAGSNPSYDPFAEKA